MNALVQYVTAPFEDAGNLPVTIPPLPAAGADRRYHVNTLTGGPGTPVPTWYDVDGGNPWPAVSTAPTLVTDTALRGQRAIDFNGTTDRYSDTHAQSQPYSLALVGRVVTITPATLTTITASAQNAAELLIGQNGSFGLRNSSATFYGPPADTAWHVFVCVFDGASSHLTIDGQRWTGDSGTGTRTYRILGAAGGGFRPTAIRAAEFATWDRALTTSEADAIVTALRAAHGI